MIIYVVLKRPLFEMALNTVIATSIVELVGVEQN